MKMFVKVGYCTSSGIIYDPDYLLLHYGPIKHYWEYEIETKRIRVAQERKFIGTESKIIKTPKMFLTSIKEFLKVCYVK